jgi:hypothetical protein
MKQYLDWQSVLKNMTATATVSVLTLVSLGDASQISLSLFVVASLKEAMASTAIVTVGAFT